MRRTTTARERAHDDDDGARRVRGRRAALAACLLGSLVIGGCTDATSASSPSAAAGESAGLAPSADPTPAALPVEQLHWLTWPDATPVDAQALDPETITALDPATVTETTIPVSDRVQPFAVLDDGSILVAQEPDRDVDYDGVPEVGRWSDGKFTRIATSRKLLKKDGRREVQHASTDGTTLVWSEAQYQGGMTKAWRIFAAPLAGGKARLLAREEQLVKGELEHFWVPPRPYIADGKVVFSAGARVGDEGLRYSVITVGLDGKGLEVQLERALFPQPAAAGSLVVRDGYTRGKERKNRDVPVHGIEVLAPDGSTELFLNVVDDHFSFEVAEPIGITGNHVVVHGYEEVVTVDRTTRTAHKVRAPYRHDVRYLEVCDDLVAWTTSHRANGDDTAAFILQPSTGRTARLPVTDVVNSIECGGGTVAWTSRTMDWEADLRLQSAPVPW